MSQEKLVKLLNEYLGKSDRHVLYGPDSGGYNIEGAVQLIVTDKGIKISFNHYEATGRHEWVEDESVELKVKE